MQQQRPAQELVDAKATAAQAHALAHTTRVRLWTTLGDGDATISQLAHRLSLNKGSVSHHLRILVGAGLARRADTRTVRGGTEQYYARGTDRVLVPTERGPDTASGAMLRDLVDQIETSRAPRVHQRTLRLAPAQAVALADHLDRLLEGLTPADERLPTYGVVTAVFRRQ